MLFKCKSCGSNVVYEPKLGKMYCPHCESEDSADLIRGGAMTQCASCGAPMEAPDYASAGRCEHCGCYAVFDERVTGAYEPHMILPFRVSKHDAVSAMDAEFKKRVFTPSDFMSAKSLEKMVGIYVPFWLYDYNACYDFEGEGTRIRTWRSGNMEYTETSYYDVVRKMEVGFDRIPVDASYAMDDSTMDLMEPYDYQMLQDFEPGYMSGFYGEVYNQGAPQLEDRARGKARGASEELMQESLQGYQTMRPRRKDLNLHRDGASYALMPVWQYLYRYRGRTYQYHVNGQTAKVIGTTPVSAVKVLAYGASVFAIVTAVCSLAILLFAFISGGHAAISRAADYQRTNTECATDERVFDYGNVLTAKEEDKLRKLIAKREKQTGCDIVLITLRQSLKDYARAIEPHVDYDEFVRVYAEAFYEENRFGYDRPNGDGVLLVDNWYREDDGRIYTWFCTTGKVKDAYSDIEIDHILDNVYRYVERRPYRAYKTYVDDFYHDMMGIQICNVYVPDAVPWIIGMITSVIFILCNFRSKKGVKTTTAATYMDGMQPRFRVREDRFLRKSVVSRKIEMSGHGGGSHGGGGGHGGGGSHGGGGHSR